MYTKDETDFPTGVREVLHNMSSQNSELKG